MGRVGLLDGIIVRKCCKNYNIKLVVLELESLVLGVGLCCKNYLIFGDFRV